MRMHGSSKGDEKGEGKQKKNKQNKKKYLHQMSMKQSQLKRDTFSEQIQLIYRFRKPQNSGFFIYSGYNTIAIIKSKQLQMSGKVNPSTSSKIIVEEFSRADFQLEEVVGQKKQASVPVQSAGLATSKKLVIGLIVGFLVVAGLAVGLGVGLTRKKDNITIVTPTPSPSPSPTPTPVLPFTCANYPSECTGVAESIQTYILGAYPSIDEARSVMQLSRNFAALSAATTSQQRVTSYRSIMRATECMFYNMPTSYSSAYQSLIDIQFPDAAGVQAILTMNQEFSGQPIRLTPSAQLPNVCQFTITSPPASRRMLTITPCPAENSVLIFLGGMAYSPSSIVQNLRELQKVLETNAGSTFNGGYIYLGAKRVVSPYFMTDLVPNVRNFQTSNGMPPSSVDDIKKCIQLMLDHKNINTRRPAGIQAFGYRLLRKVARNMLAFQLKYNQVAYDLAGHVNLIVQHINEGKKVVLVGHGQGSLYANWLYNLLSADQKTKVAEVFIAPFAPDILDSSGTYITHDGDEVIAGLMLDFNLVSFSPLAHNEISATFDQNADSGQKHGMMGYLGAYQSQIITLVSNARARIAQPTATLGLGLITVSLTWDAQPDIDLYIIEPNFQVYKGAPNGNSGTLDLDDSDGHGPEHYHTDCNIQTGTYQVRASYYAGYANTMATVVVTAGSEYFRRTLLIPSNTPANGLSSVGDTPLPPYAFCSISVTRPGNAYKFVITPL